MLMLDPLIDTLDRIYAQALEQEREFATEIQAAHPRLRASARNLVHYFALRNSDVRTIQNELAELGLSSLGRSEAHTLTTLNAVRAMVYALRDQKPVQAITTDAISFEEGKNQLRDNACALLGPEPDSRQVRIMVTLPESAADDYGLIRQLVEAGMNVARVNCAHDDEETWEKMIRNVRLVAEELDCGCKVLMDLAGPKIRTGELEPGPKVIKSRPQRDAEGKVQMPARVLFVPKGEIVNITLENTIIVPITSEWTRTVHEGDEVRFTDTRGRRRALEIVHVLEHAVLTEGERTSYFKTGMRLRLKRHDADGKRRTDEYLTVGELPEQPGFLLLKRGDMLVLTREGTGAEAQRTETGQVLEPARIACTVPEVVAALRPGDRVKFDDGKIESVVRKIEGKAHWSKLRWQRTRAASCARKKGSTSPTRIYHCAV